MKVPSLTDVEKKDDDDASAQRSSALGIQAGGRQVHNKSSGRDV